MSDDKIHDLTILYLQQHPKDMYGYDSIKSMVNRYFEIKKDIKEEIQIYQRKNNNYI